jgi:hypothetical protein
MTGDPITASPILNVLIALASISTSVGITAWAVNYLSKARSE